MTIPAEMNKNELIKLIEDMENLLIKKDMFREAFNQAPGAILITSQPGEIIECNQSALKLYGYSSSEILKLTMIDLLSEETADRIPELLKEESQSGGMDVRAVHKKKNGRPIPVIMITRLFTANEQHYRMMIIHDMADVEKTLKDTVPQTMTTEELSDILPEMTGEPEMVFETDQKGFIQRANTVFHDKTGYSNTDFKKGLNITHFFFPSNPGDKLGDITSLLPEKMKGINEFNLLCRDGSIMPVMGLFTTTISKRKTGGYKIHTYDVSEQKRFEHNLKMMEKLNALGETAGGVIHDFNNILSIILGNIEMLEKKFGSPHIFDITRKIRSAAVDGAVIVRRLQDFSQVYIQQSEEYIDINKIIIDTLDILKPKWFHIPLSQGIIIQVETDLKEVPEILGTAAEIREVLNNIMLNALDAMPKGGTITIKTDHVENFVLLTISDTGSGMSPETQKRLFEPFYTTKKNKGTGLGLSISFGIIKKFGGSISVESEQGAGSTFIITLPSIKGKTTNQKSAEKQHPADNQDEILVVDDEENICSLLREFLQKEGFTVTVATGGAKGLDYAKHHTYPVVITDLNMPGVSGWELARYIKLKNPETIIIMLSGWEETILALNAKEPTVDLILQKPISFSKLSDFIGKIRNKR
ncbi:PAS domain S-box protein [bacterium]|nr:PAS domain S-box protein [bacterium]